MTAKLLPSRFADLRRHDSWSSHRMRLEFVPETLAQVSLPGIGEDGHDDCIALRLLCHAKTAGHRSSPGNTYQQVQETLLIFSGKISNSWPLWASQIVAFPP